MAFAGKNSINAELFTKTVNDIIALIKASSRAISPNCFLRLEIKANHEGSFITEIDAIIKYVPDLLTLSSIAANIIQGVLNFFLIKQHLNGNKPKKLEKSDGKMAIQNQAGEILKIDSRIGDAFFENNKIDNLIVNIGKSLLDSDRESFSIETKNEKVTINEDDYQSLASPILNQKNIAKNIVMKTEVQKPVEVNLLLKKSHWEFTYNKTISVKIEDQDFLENIHTGKIKKLYAGVKIPCLLKIEYDLDGCYNPIINSDRYTILKVTGDIIEPKENNLSLF